MQIRKKGSALGIEPLETTVEPADISIKIENKISRDINIIPSFKGFIAEGYEMTSQSINPSSITAEGPRSIIESISEFNTAPIDLEGRFGNFSILVNIIVNDPLIITHGNSMIEYRAAIRQIPRELPAPIQTFKEAEEE